MSEIEGLVLMLKGLISEESEEVQKEMRQTMDHFRDEMSKLNDENKIAALVVCMEEVEKLS